jgi:hypothetical protein
MDMRVGAGGITASPPSLIHVFNPDSAGRGGIWHGRREQFAGR